MVPGVSSFHYPEVPWSISFSGSGFLATYQLGVAKCLLNYAPWILRTAPCVLGASAGSLVAAAVVCEISPVLHLGGGIQSDKAKTEQADQEGKGDWCQTACSFSGGCGKQENVGQDPTILDTSHPLCNELWHGKLIEPKSTICDEMLHFAKKMKAFTLGPFNPSINVFHWLECVLNKYLPSDAHQLASGRLGVAMTRLTDGKHIVMSEFQSKEDVVQALLCSCFVPGYCGMQAPSFKGVHYVDGGFSRMQPVLPSHTLTVSPFSGEIDICPTDTPCMWNIVVSGATLKGNMANSFRILNALYPIALETLEQAYHSGYKDAINFILQNDLAPYLTIQKTKLFKGPPICNETETVTHLDATTGDEEEVKVEKETVALTSFIGNRHSNEHELARNQPISQPTLHFNIVKNVLLGNVVTYLSMFALPVRILSYLLIPLILLFYIVLQSRYRQELLLQVTELVFCTWHGLRHFALFVCSILVSSLKKNINDRVIPIFLFLQWLKIQAYYEAGPLTPNNL